MLAAALLEEIYARDLAEDSITFWACLRRAFPDAMSAGTRSADYGGALANVSLVYLAGTETTATSLGMTLAVLAAHPQTLRRLEEVCSLLQSALCGARAHADFLLRGCKWLVCCTAMLSCPLP